MMSGGETEAHDLPVVASAMAVTSDGRQLLLAKDGLHFRDLRSGALTPNRPLDIRGSTIRSNYARGIP